VQQKILIWIGSSKKDLLTFSEEVKRSMGYGQGVK
jgi:phage-related protein